MNPARLLSPITPPPQDPAARVAPIAPAAPAAAPPAASPGAPALEVPLGPALLVLAAPAGAVALPAVGRPRSARAPAIPERIGAALEQTRQALVARREVYAAVIARHEQTIQALEAELTEVNQRISQKTGEAQDLAQRKARLASQIAEKRRLATAAGVYGGIMGIFTFGASAAVGASMAAAAAVAIASLSSDLGRAERAERDARSTLGDLERAGSAHRAAQDAAKKQLDQLRAEHGSLTAAAPVVPSDAAPREVVAALEAAVANDKAIIGNLQKQIAVLEVARKQARTFEASLDKTIARLQQDVADLEKQVEQSRRALVSSLIDVALAGFGATSALKAAGLALSEKELLMAGLDLARGDVEGVVKGLVDKLVSSSLVSATDSPLLGKALTALTTAASPQVDAKAKVAALVAAAVAPLSEPQRAVLDRLSEVTAFDPEPLARAVIDAPMGQDEAAAIARMLERA